MIRLSNNCEICHTPKSAKMRVWHGVRELSLCGPCEHAVYVRIAEHYGRNIPKRFATLVGMLLAELKGEWDSGHEIRGSQ